MKLTKIIAGLLVVLAMALALMAWYMLRQPSRPVAPVPMVSQSTSQPAPQAKKEEPQYSVVVLAKDVPAGHKLTRDDLQLAQLPAAVPGSFDALDSVLGHTTALALREKTPLFEQNLISGLALQLEPGQRAVAIGVNENMAAGHRVRPGDYVDVFVTLGADTREQSPVDTQNRLLMARTRVLAYGGATVENPPLTVAQQQKAQQEQQDNASALSSSRRTSNQTNREDQSLRPENAKTAVLAVPLDDVQRLNLAEKYGQLTLALRHPDDQAVPDAALFNALPAVLRPKPGSLPQGQELQGLDRAFAGMRFDDLATGGDEKNRKRAAAQLLPAPGEKAPPRPRLHEVEMHNGAQVQTVRY
ncbi:Flp pilus assembly protein CpaB [Lampropedia puyangensis]|uniref:Flp pilus assembly protein CpaB n=1 Tax=Lampropedia puyangensis TaxID=1330072 RepID=A0A4S8EZA6_9BURK|nr:Flp pilus assembly protein CpaB [Lampropedia puyangensis]THT99966.1 Flp pilus assembly protein CpaB [Lampropedia puyangensis]